MKRWLAVLFWGLTLVECFAPAPKLRTSRTLVHDDSSLYLFGKLLEENGVLGKGITVGKVQVALISQERGKDSIFGDLERKARSTGGSSAHLAILVKEVCLALLRRSDDWTAARSESKWFPFRDSSRAEALFNDWTDAEALKFEKVRAQVVARRLWDNNELTTRLCAYSYAKEYIPGTDTEEKGSSTMVVVSLIVEIEGDSTT